MPYNPESGQYPRRPDGQFGKPLVPSPAQNFAPRDPYGATDDTPEAIDFGRLIVDGQRTTRLRYGGENHALIFGKSGSGKDVRLLIPNLLRMRGNRSIVCVDPKGEMAACTFPHRSKLHRANGGRAIVLNPFGVLCDLRGYGYMEGLGFNPLRALNPHSPEFNKDAGLLAEALIPMTGNEKEPFFPLMARALVGGLIMYEVVKAKEQGRDPFLFHVRRMICEASAEAVPPRIIGGAVVKEGVPATGIPAYALEMANSVIMGMRNKGGQFVNWNKEIHSVASTARAETEFLDDPEMAYCLAQNGFDFSEVKERPTTVYLVLPMEVMHRHGKWLRMVLTAALRACMRPRGANAPRTLFIFNEFAALGHLQLIEDNFTVVRGAGIQMMPVLQDLNQLKQIYDKRWQTFIANADVTATFAPNDTESAEWFSKRCGETTELKIAVTENYGNNSGNTQSQGTSPTGETGNTGTSGGSNYGWSAAHSLEKLPLVTPYQLHSMQPGEMRIIRAGMGDTLQAHALPYFEMGNLMAETRPPENPYKPGANIPRIARQMPDYEAFQRQMLGALPPIEESPGNALRYSPNWRETPSPPSSPQQPAVRFAQNGSIFGGEVTASPNDSTGNAPQGDSRWTLFTSMKNSDVSNPPHDHGGWVQPKKPYEPQATAPATAQVSPWLNPAHYTAGGNQPPPPPPTQDNRTVNINFTFINSGSGTMNVNLASGGTAQRNGSGYVDSGTWEPAAWPKSEPPAAAKMQLFSPAPPEPPKRPLALSAPLRTQRQPQAPDNIRGGVQAQHPGYTPDPPKHGGDDWAYDES